MFFYCKKTKKNLKFIYLGDVLSDDGHLSASPPTHAGASTTTFVVSGTGAALRNGKSKFCLLETKINWLVFRCCFDFDCLGVSGTLDADARRERRQAAAALRQRRHGEHRVCELIFFWFDSILIYLLFFLNKSLVLHLLLVQ